MARVLKTTTKRVEIGGQSLTAPPKDVPRTWRTTLWIRMGRVFRLIRGERPQQK